MNGTLYAMGAKHVYIASWILIILFLGDVSTSLGKTETESSRTDQPVFPNDAGQSADVPGPHTVRDQVVDDQGYVAKVINDKEVDGDLFISNLCDADGCRDARQASLVDARVKAFSQEDIMDVAFSFDTKTIGGLKNTCLVPGLDAICGVLHRGIFCWASFDGEYCTLSEALVSPDDAGVHDEEEQPALEDDEQKPEVQQITQKVLEVLPEAAKVNFALSRDGAKVLASNHGAKRVGALLDDDSDTFMRNDCKDNKWVVIELSQVARVSSLEIAQNELYSSRLKEFSVYGMQSHPRTLATLESPANVDSGWNFIGKFEGKKSKGVQAFNVDNSRWVRYLLIRFLTHHGTESVCAINEISVYGTSAAEELEAQLAHDEFVFDSMKDANEEISIKEDINGTSKSNSVPLVIREEGHDNTNASETVQLDKTFINTSETILIVMNQSTVSSMQKIISENLFSYAASNHSSREHMPPVCIHEDNLVAEVNTTVSKVREDGKMKIGNAPHVAAPPPGTDDIMQIPKPKTGGNLYETLIQELRGTKAQQKMISKSLEGMHKNVETVAEELASLRRSSGLLGSLEVQQKIDQMEIKLRQMSKISANQSNAAIALFSAVMGAIVLQLEMFSSLSKKSILTDIAKSLIALNVFVGGALMLRGAFATF